MQHVMGFDAAYCGDPCRKTDVGYRVHDDGYSKCDDITADLRTIAARFALILSAAVVGDCVGVSCDFPNPTTSQLFGAKLHQEGTAMCAVHNDFLVEFNELYPNSEFVEDRLRITFSGDHLRAREWLRAVRKKHFANMSQAPITFWPTDPDPHWIETTIHDASKMYDFEAAAWANSQHRWGFKTREDELGEIISRSYFFEDAGDLVYAKFKT